MILFTRTPIVPALVLSVRQEELMNSVSTTQTINRRNVPEDHSTANASKEHTISFTIKAINGHTLLRLSDDPNHEKESFTNQKYLSVQRAEKNDTNHFQIGRNPLTNKRLFTTLAISEPVAHALDSLLAQPGWS